MHPFPFQRLSPLSETAAGLSMLWQWREMSTCSAGAQSCGHQRPSSSAWCCRLGLLCFLYSEVCPCLQIFVSGLPYPTMSNFICSLNMSTSYFSISVPMQRASRVAGGTTFCGHVVGRGTSV